jgi:hypothetical protein
MAEEETKQKKQTTVGYISEPAYKKLKGWGEYDKAAKALTAAREVSTEKKQVIREQLQDKYGDDVDFAMQPDGRMHVFRDLQRAKRARGKDLSGDF